MTVEEYRHTAGEMLWLIGCLLSGENPEEKRASRINRDSLYETARRHMLTAAAAMALENAGVKDPRFTEEEAKAIRKAILLEADRKAICRRFEEAEIWYLPLKGSVIGHWYPRFGMRQMSDVDILINPDRAADAKDIMESLGFTVYDYGKTVHDIYHKPPVSNVELHRALFAQMHGMNLAGYYQGIRERLIRDEGSAFGYHMRPEDFYIYLLAHEYKHYSGSGTGLRSLLDLHIFLKRFGQELDWQYVKEETEKLDIAAFAAQSRSLAAHLFLPEKQTPADREMLEYVISSGVYGNTGNYVRNRIAERGGGVRGTLLYLKNRLFMPMDQVRVWYPFFYRHRILLPVLPFCRLIKNWHTGRVRQEIRVLLRDMRKTVRGEKR